MSLGTNIKLELYWQGPYSYRGNWDLSVVDIKMKDSAHEISAHIDTHQPATQEQRLNFRVSKKGASYIEKYQESATIECPSYFLKTMEISARIFQTYENRSTLIRQLDGSYAFETRARRDDLPVFIDALPDFAPNATYQIKIANQDIAPRATIIKKVSEMPTPQFSEEKESPSTAEASAEKVDQISKAFAGLERMIEAASSHDQALDGIETSELQNRLEQANQRMIAARIRFERATTETELMVELSTKQQIMREIISLQRALQSRGIPQEDLSSQGCIIS